MNPNNNITSLPGLMIETAFNPDFASKGRQKSIDFINSDLTSDSQSEALVLLTSDCLSNETLTGNVHAAVFIDAKMTVTHVFSNISSSEVVPPLKEAIDMAVSKGGFALLAHGGTPSEHEKFLTENFKAGDHVKLIYNGTEITLEQTLAMAGHHAASQIKLNIDGNTMYTTTETTATISGTVSNTDSNSTYRISVQLFDASGNKAGSAMIGVDEKGKFKGSINLLSGVNYIDATVVENGNHLGDTTESLILFRKDRVTEPKDKQVIMWMDQYSSAKALNTAEKIDAMIVTAKNAGVTAFAFDVKGTEGYASYKKATLSNTPYMTNTLNPNKHVDMEIDFLQEMINACHRHGLKLYASLNFFTEGNLQADDSAFDIFNKHRDWAEIFQAPEDKGELRSVLDTNRSCLLAYVNPANEEVQQLQLQRVEEILMNYDVDGIVLDRCRYDNFYADFSDISRTKFEHYLAGFSKRLDNWPGDVYTIQADGSMVQGKYFYEWLTFRCHVIRDFVKNLKILIKKYENAKNRNISLSAYVGSWYEIYYQVGVNWADKNFKYNSRLEFPLPDLYTDEYSRSSYLEYLDFLMIGCYFDTEEKISRYTTLGHIATDGKVPLLGSISIPDLKTPESQRHGFQAAYNNSDGAMIFDLCYVNWDWMKYAIKGRE